MTPGTLEEPFPGRTAVAPRIVAILPCAEPVTGGVQADHAILAELRDRGWTVETLYFARTSARAMSARWWTQLLAGLRLAWQLRRLPAGAILLEDHALSLAVALGNWYARRFRGARVVMIVYHLSYLLWKHPFRRELHRVVEAREARRADRLLVSSRHTWKELRALGVEDHRVRLISLGVRAPERAPVSPAYATGKTTRLLSVGTVEPRKGLHFLVQALALLRDEPWELEIAGGADGRYLGRLTQLIGRLALADRIQLLGRVTDEHLEELMARADIFVHPSLQEGFGLAVGEAMAHGLPVIASSGGALGEMVEDGRTGLLVRSASPDDLAVAIRRLIHDPELRRSLGEAAAQTVSGRYSWQKTGAQVDAALREL
ncbi:MAG TPA: glycosyltransferase family 4 protein [Chloroflexota bacterium]|nr:glycosyltransferase family 4 protein [Chloroflexota bacterium]